MRLGALSKHLLWHTPAVLFLVIIELPVTKVFPDIDAVPFLREQCYTGLNKAFSLKQGFLSQALLIAIH